MEDTITMKVSLFETTNATPHLETSFELAQRHLEQGDEVSYYFLGHAVPFAEFMHRRIPFIVGCSPERKAAKLLGTKLSYIEPSISQADHEIFLNRQFSSTKELRSFKYKNYRAGLSALSSLISYTRSSSPDIYAHKNLINKILISGISIYEYVLREINDQSPDLIYLFNGRFAVNRAILDAAIETGITFRVHERGTRKNKYISNPWMPHDQARAKDVMLNHWDSRQDAQKSQIARQFFLERRQGKEQGWKSFVRSQEKNRLPALPSGRKVVAYFSSSDDEYAAVGDIVKWDRWPDQLSAVRDLINLVAKHGDLYLVIRLHPHKAEKDPLDLARWMELILPENSTLISPDDSVDTYALIDRADIVVSSGSTTGIESVFWHTPSICLGPSVYSHLDAVYLPADKEELEQMILNISLQADSEKTLPYGYFKATYGEEFLYYEPESLFRGRFMGVNLQSFGLCKYLRATLVLPVRIGRKILKTLHRRYLKVKESCNVKSD